MNKLKYVDKEILCQYSLSEEFFDSLGLEVEDIIPLRKVFLLFTNEGKKILKITDSKEDRINFINESLRYIKKEYPKVLSYFQCKNGKVINEYKNKKYVVLDMIEGRESTFTNPIEIELCAKAIANMHKASRGIFNKFNVDLIKGNLGEYLPEYFNRAVEDIKSIKNYAQRLKNPCEFDNIFLDNVDKYIEQIKNAEELLAMTEYNEILEDYNKRALCHNDLAHHNFIVDGEDIKIIDFDYCKIDIRIVDIANYSLKAIKNSKYDMEKFKLIIESYNSIEKLEKEEIKLIYILFNFPRDFITISRDYYFKQKKWEYEVFLNRLKDKIGAEEYRQDFLNNYIIEMKDHLY